MICNEALQTASGVIGPLTAHATFVACARAAEYLRQNDFSRQLISTEQLLRDSGWGEKKVTDFVFDRLSHS